MKRFGSLSLVNGGMVAGTRKSSLSLMSTSHRAAALRLASCPFVLPGRRGYATEPKKLTMREALREALAEEMERDSRVVIMGEEVGQYQGAYKVTKDLMDKFGRDRVIDTPITEMGFAGIGAGAALGGILPIVEFMTFNFAMQAIDQIVNSAAKTRYMSGGALSCPVVFRGPNGPPTSVGAQHSQCFASWYGNIPGLLVLAPADCDDAKGLLKTAIRNPNPVVFLENELLYNTTFDLSPEAQSADFLIPPGKAQVRRQGKHVTIATFSRMVTVAMEAAEKLKQEGIEAEVINLRSIRPLDLNTLLTSVKKTNRLVTVEEGYPQFGVGAELIAAVNEHAFDWLDAAPERVTGADVPMPYSPPLEEKAMVYSHNIVNAVKRTLYRKK
ncbi:Pyruvate dehydrogenase E1 component subunit beta [Balamuthia mandrillaris]